MTAGFARISSGCLGDHRTEVEHVDPFGQRHDEFHVVLDQQYADVTARRAPDG